MKLVIVESPAKARKISSFLGDGWRVEATRGHIRDLPETELGVDVNHDFRPTYTVLPGKTNLVRRLIKAIQEAEAVYIATDPDREGEALAWHVLKLANLPPDKPVYRTVFTAITQEVVRQAMSQPRPLDSRLVEAQQAARMLDRLIGYLVSPLAAKALNRHVTASRVPSAALRLVVEREREIVSFQPETHFELVVSLKSTDGSRPFEARLHHIQNLDLPLRTRQPAEQVANLLRRAQFWVSRYGQVEKLRQPLPPFTTTSMLQAATEALGITPDKIMVRAQQLYEAGLITYIHTTGVMVPPEAEQSARTFIRREYDLDYLPDEAPVYPVNASQSQEVHEAIRPTDINHLPTTVTGTGAALYALIWKRFVASQMPPARYQAAGIVIHAGKVMGQPYPMELRAQGRQLVFDGFLKVYEEPLDLDVIPGKVDQVLPRLQQGQVLQLVEPVLSEVQTEPLARYSAAGLLLALEQRGIRHSSMFAGMINFLADKGYVQLSDNQLVPTELGAALFDFLSTQFPNLLTWDAVTQLELDLDRVACGEASRLDVLRQFWAGFQPQLAAAAEYAMAQVKVRTTAKPLTLHPVEV